MQREAYERVVESIREQGGTAKYPVDIADIGALAVDGEDAIMPIACRLNRRAVSCARLEAFTDEKSLGLQKHLHPEVSDRIRRGRGQEPRGCCQVQ